MVDGLHFNKFKNTDLLFLFENKMMLLMFCNKLHFHTKASEERAQKGVRAQQNMIYVIVQRSATVETKTDKALVNPIAKAEHFL